MEIRYQSVIEYIKNLPLADKEDQKRLIEKYIIEERRDRIYANYQDALKEYREGKLKFFHM